ncbi:MAG: hypothetical protein FWH37_01975 [Candidatus Bathyarchaeota archaeon]|nr:hypothetical protein [Candidatus Termiticorpusculum sp.]
MPQVAKDSSENATVIRKEAVITDKFEAVAFEEALNNLKGRYTEALDNLKKRYTKKKLDCRCWGKLQQK